ncbi:MULTISPECIES: C40 family peptidase [Dactylosporangium]|uniref:NlpC/P60 family protein n=1 Tax=Dactylosporangium vinaceum TaxID=53362 RepID=A0ABV5M6A8_9ACTN|nr:MULTISPECIES: C40 family peptidase [Dactylosporangium]UAB97804.1 C40 family peptidase [Dactylosporangium vinaceum]UWZ46046.1 C40 family peptidase [Dactylosporangium matsuzakiense]
MSTGHRARRSVLRTLLIGFISLTVLAPATVAHADPTLAEIEAQLKKQNDDLELTIENWNKLNIDMADSQAKAAELEKHVNEANDGVQAIAIEAFKSNGKLRNLNAMLNATSSGSLIDQMSMLQQITHQQQKSIEEYRAAKATLDQTIAAQNTQKADYENQRKKIEGDVKKLEDLQKKAKNAGSTKVTGASYNPGTLPAVSGNAGAAVNYAKSKLGKPYVYGAAGPNSFDCSGLTMAAWAAAGVSLPHNAASQWSKVAHIPRSALAPGDLVFYNGLGHVGIYVGNDTIIHAPHTGDVVRYASVSVDSIYGYGRVK